MKTLTRTRPGLAEIVEGVRALVDPSADPRATAFAVADLLRERLPSAEILTEEERLGDPDGYVGHTLHAEEGFSVVAVVWRPGQRTAIHDHIAWCVFGVLCGVEYETLYRDHGDHLTEIGRTANQTGEVSGFAPPGDIHRVHNTGDETAISLHIYGADLSAAPTSVRRVYDLPVR
ncbi:cysteine dioxygenase family protein [Streptosporangium amethystogenes]|uniref:cysteine dioxygenase family protein n=1 Tax=Streptosporangium amethystogenes TaxID=2002 RepID=UPI0004CAF050|nr:cysteine dioxygenase family protein [Streptosporangium amethystogenes]